MSAPASTRVLVAHDAEPIRQVIVHLLVEAGWQVESVADGAAARAALSDPPAGMVLDVALGGVLAYQLVDEVRARGLPTKVVLIASIYNRTGYKRRPTSLYGADDYVEQHHIPDALVPKLARLLEVAPRGGHDAAEEERDQTTIREAALRASGDLPEAEPGAEDKKPPDGAPTPIERAQRLARLIVADIALYNGDALAQASQTDSRDELNARLRHDLEEGRLLFDLRVPEAVRRDRDFIAEALEALVGQRKA